MEQDCLVNDLVLSRFSSTHLQSDDQDAGHLGGLLHVEELRLLSPGWPDATRGETGAALVPRKRRSHRRDLAQLFDFLFSSQETGNAYMCFRVLADLDQCIQ